MPPSSYHAVERSALTLLLLLACIPTAYAQYTDAADTSDQLEAIERTLANPTTRARITARQRQTYGEQLTDALASGHEGLQQAALHLIARYGDALQLGQPAVFDVLRIYCSHPKDQMRRMAVAALGQMQDPWTMAFLQHSLRYEETPSVRYTILTVLNTHGMLKLGPATIAG